MKRKKFYTICPPTLKISVWIIDITMITCMVVIGILSFAMSDDFKTVRGFRQAAWGDIPLDDKIAVSDVLVKLKLITMDPANIGSGNITRAMLHVLHCGYGFLYREAGKNSTRVVNIPSYSESIRNAAKGSLLTVEIQRLLSHGLDDILKENTMPIYGMDTAIKVLKDVLTPQAFKTFLCAINWSIVDTIDNIIMSVTAEIPVIEDSGNVKMSSYSEGIMAALTLYPELELRYTASIDDVQLIPRYDSSITLVDIDVEPSHGITHRLVVPTENFIDYYVNFSKHHLTTACLHFHSMQFIYGMFTMPAIADIVMEQDMVINVCQNGKWPGSYS